MKKTFGILFFLSSLLHCGSQLNGSATPVAAIEKPTVFDNGNEIIFPPDYLGLKRIHTQKIQKGNGSFSITAPAKIMAAIQVQKNSRIALFESQELTTLYAQHRTARINAQRAARSLSRTKDMFESQVATQREVIDAESEAASTRAAVSEMEARMRAYGINPKEIESVHRDTVWLIADIPEAQISEVRKGQKVKIIFASLPGEEKQGRAEAISDNIDPMTRTAKIRISVANPKRVLKSGMFAEVNFGETKSNFITLPADAVITVENQNYVFVKRKGNEFIRRAVTTLPSRTNFVAIASGISRDDEVVVHGAILLKGLSFGY
ncbi:MAG TPA: efflux RND transporter periplasmic adaptor subunit [Turneriella sp.]|nr:efflux RND transporter periplasmic adaptor subunit [Turneriella sp.]